MSIKPSNILLINILITGAFYVAGFIALGSSYPTIDSSGEQIVYWLLSNGLNARFYAWTAAFFSLGLAIFDG